MKKIVFYLSTLFGFFNYSNAQDTFSIVAADSTTRELGSAGASCVDLFQLGIADPSFLSDLIPNVGGINCQAAYLSMNQTNARTRMLNGDTPETIINWLIANDAELNPEIRQYGVVGFNGAATSAAGFTGTNCFDYKNHIIGSIDGIYYSIQGNILSGQSILDSMEMRFRNANGDLSCRLMAAMQGANVVGADTRCTANGTSSLFAFIKVTEPTDLYNEPSFFLGVKTSSGDNIEPIDSLQTLFNIEKSCGNLGINVLNLDDNFLIYPNPSSGDFTLNLPIDQGVILVTDMFGNELMKSHTILNSTSFHIDKPGVYIVWIFTNLGSYKRKIVVTK